MGRSRRVVILALVVAWAGMVAGCGGLTSAGPLVSVAEGGRTLVDAAGRTAVGPGGLAVVTAYLSGHVDGPVTFLSASLVPVPGFPAGSLAHVALVTNHNLVEGDMQWPPPPGDGVPIRPFVGAVAEPHPQVNIVYAMRVGTVPGKAYVAAGLRIRYLYQGQVYTTMAWLVTVGCVVSHPDHQDPPWCEKAINQATRVVEKQAGVS